MACDKINSDYVLRSGELMADPKKFTRIWLWLLGLWGVVEILCLIAGKSWKSQLAYFLIFMTIALVVGLEKLIEKWLPDGAQRHRVLGRVTMIMFALILCCLAYFVCQGSNASRNWDKRLTVERTSRSEM